MRYHLLLLFIVCLLLAEKNNNNLARAQEETPTANDNEQEEEVEEEEPPFEPFLGYPEDHEFTPFEFDRGDILVPYLNKEYQQPAALREISNMLQEGHLVVLENAFDETFAERMHEELWAIGEDEESTSSPYYWELNEEYVEDGFQYHHHNVYDYDKMPPFVQEAVDLFTSNKTKEFAHVMSGRDTFGESVPAPSWYAPHDYSLPHSDYFDQRTVAFVWHLSKNWKSEYGGALYWCHEKSSYAYVPAAFNSLFLFDVTAETSHFVTNVSPHAEGKRLAFNGWWNAVYEPDMYDEQLPKYLASWKNRGNLTAFQYDTLMQYLEEIDEQHDGQDPPGNEGLHHALQLVEMEMEQRPESTAIFDAEPYRRDDPLMDAAAAYDSEVEEL